MGRLFFAVFPVFILVVSSLVSGGSTLTGQAQNVCFNIGQTQCTQNQNMVTYHCPGPGPGFTNYTTCKVASSCTPVLPAPAYCFLGIQVINPGETLTVQVTQTSNQGLFNFGAIGSSGLVAIVGVAVAVAVLAGFNILGSGLNPQSVKILFISGLLVGVWLFFATLEGFPGGNSASFFTQLNNAVLYWKLPPFGTIFYILLSCIEVYGIISFNAGGDS